MTTALGSAPRLFARETAIGIINAVVAVFDIKFVNAQVTINITSKSTDWFPKDLRFYLQSGCLHL